MEATSPAGEPSDLRQLSDDKLVQLFPVKKQPRETRDEKGLSAQERRALDELWNRHREQLERNLRAKIFAPGSTLCPPQEPDKKQFLQMCMNEAYLAYLRRLCRNEFTNIGGFLFTLVLRVALDVRKKLVGRGDPVDQISIDDLEKPLIEEGDNPLQVVAVRKACDVMKSVIQDHVRSFKDVLSVRAVIFRRVCKWPWKQIAEKLLPEDAYATSCKNRYEEVRSLEQDDAMDLLRRLKERGVTDPHLFEL